MLKAVLICLLLPFVLTPSLQADVHVSDYHIDVTFDPTRSSMRALALITFDSIPVPSDSLVFFLHGELGVDSISAEGQGIAFDQQSVYYYHDYSLIASRVALRLPPGRSGPISVHYSGYFNRSKARSPSDYMRIDEKGVFLRALGYSPWFPVFLQSDSDSYATNFSEVVIRTPVDYVPVFAGDRISESEGDSVRISRWRAMQLDLIGAQCTAQKFKMSSQGNLFLYHYTDSISTAMAVSILRFVQELNAEYSDKYRKNVSVGQMHVMEMPPYGDISSGNVTGITAGIWQTFDTDEWSKRGLAHELVHPFVQTTTKSTDSLFALEIEGFPSYFHLPIIAKQFGQDWYEKYMLRTEDEYLKKKRTGLGWHDRSLPKEKPLAAISAGEVGVYKDEFVLDDRALLFLNWIYRQMGRDRFFEFTRELFNSDKVTFQSFRKLILKYLPSAGDDLDTWLKTTDYPQRFYLRAP